MKSKRLLTTILLLAVTIMYTSFVMKQQKVNFNTTKITSVYKSFELLTTK